MRIFVIASCFTCLYLGFVSSTPVSCSRPILPRQITDDGSGPKELLGDLLNGITTPVGQIIANILLGKETGQSDELALRPLICPPTDKCCIWFDVSTALTLLFKGLDGNCNDNARAAIRLGFHDAGAWSKTNKANGKDFGGADGSIIMGFGEELRTENNGLQSIISILRTIRALFKVGAADLVQFAAAHATITCPLAPRIRTFVGRVDAIKAAPDGLLPSMLDPADKLFAMFKDKTIGPHDLAALLGAHSVSKQFHQDPGAVGKPQDTTPGIWDVKFYNQTLQNPPPKEIFVFKSDVVVANDPRARSEWLEFVGGQSHWNEDYAAAYVRLSMLGVNNINKLTECTKALPRTHLRIL